MCETRNLGIASYSSLSWSSLRSSLPFETAPAEPLAMWWHCRCTYFSLPVADGNPSNVHESIISHLHHNCNLIQLTMIESDTGIHGISFLAAKRTCHVPLWTARKEPAFHVWTHVWPFSWSALKISFFKHSQIQTKKPGHSMSLLPHERNAANNLS